MTFKEYYNKNIFNIDKFWNENYRINDIYRKTEQKYYNIIHDLNHLQWKI